jgi:tetratricopeptide (TPR) repeat protein
MSRLTQTSLVALLYSALFMHTGLALDAAFPNANYQLCISKPADPGVIIRNCGIVIDYITDSKRSFIWRYDPIRTTSFESRARAFVRLHDYERAIQDLSDAIETTWKPDKVSLLKERADTYLLLKKYESALIDSESIIDFQKNNQKVSYVEGLMLKSKIQLKMLRCDDAMESANDALHQNISSSKIKAGIFALRGEIDMCRDDLQSALENYNQAIYLDSSDDVSVSNRRLVLEKMGRSREATIESRAVPEVGRFNDKAGIGSLVGRWSSDSTGETVDVLSSNFGYEALISNYGRVGISITTDYSANVKLSGRDLECYYYVSLNADQRTNWSFVRGSEACPRGIFSMAK